MSARPNSWEQAALVALLVGALILGSLVEIRATCTGKHNTDLGVYLAAAQAVRDHADIYTVTYNFDHYMYPPFLAILLAPVVPAPEPFGPPSALPFATTVSLWYLLSLLALIASVWVLARTLMPILPQGALPPGPAESAVWVLRLLPIFICVHCLGRELQLGQVDLFVLALLALMIASASKGRSTQAGLWHGVAICLKVMPLVLLVYPLWRRDWRWLASASAGMVLGLVVLPLVTLGYDQSAKYAQEYVRYMVMPAVAGKVTDHSRDAEMLDQDGVHNYSILGVLHNLTNLSMPRHERPKRASDFNRHVATVMQFTLIGLTLFASGFRRRVSRLNLVLCIALLMTVMIITAPVCQSYYFVLLIPLYMALIGDDLRRSGKNFPGIGMMLVCLAYPVAQALASFSSLLRDCGLVLAAVLMLWLAGILALRRSAGEPMADNAADFPPAPV